MKLTNLPLTEKMHNHLPLSTRKQALQIAAMFEDESSAEDGIAFPLLGIVACSGQGLITQRAKRFPPEAETAAGKNRRGLEKLGARCG